MFRFVISCCLVRHAVTLGGLDESTEILWDSWGVPHIYAADRSSLFYALGWAEAQSHGEVILQRFALAQGRSAEFFGGIEKVAQDEYYLNAGLPTLGRSWYHDAPVQDREQFDSFAAGFSDYATANSGRYSEAGVRVLKNGVDGVVAATAWLMRWFDFCTSNLKERLASAQAAFSAAAISDQHHRRAPGGMKGSNAFAAKRSGGGSLLHINPHLPWASEQFFEVHLIVPSEDLDFYGVVLVGDASPVFGFGQQVGFSNTVNYVEPYTIFEHSLRPVPSSPGGWEYYWDGDWQAFTETTHSMDVLGSQRRIVSSLRSAAGPVMVVDAESRKALSLRWAADVFAGRGEKQALLSQFWDMMRADSVRSLRTILSRHQCPFFHYIAADSAGDLFFVSNSWTPDYGKGDWALWASGPPMPSNKSTDLWETVVPFSAQPQVMSPESGFVSNANDAPWQATLPLFAVKPSDSPAWYAPPPDSPSFEARFRPKACLRAVQRAVREGGDGATLASMVAASMDTYSESSRHLLDSLLEAASASSDDKIIRAKNVLKGWDRHYRHDSSGAVLWGRWLELVQGLSNGATGMSGLLAGYTIPLDFMAVPWEVTDPLDTPSKLADPSQALSLLGQVVSEMAADGVKLDASWGESCKLPQDTHGRIWPGVGSPDDSVRDMWVHLRPPLGQNVSTAYGGGTFKAVVEFFPNGSRQAFVQLAYGDSTMQDSRHNGDQWRLFSENRYRKAWLLRADVELHAARVDRLARFGEKGLEQIEGSAFASKIAAGIGAPHVLALTVLGGAMFALHGRFQRLRSPPEADLGQDFFLMVE